MTLYTVHPEASMASSKKQLLPIILDSIILIQQITMYKITYLISVIWAVTNQHNTLSLLTYSTDYQMSMLHDHKKN